MARYVLEVMYDGTLFHGSQIQGETPTVQLYVNNALSIVLRSKIETIGASRTDEGVHALCNFYHFDYSIDLNPDLLYKLNAIVPQGIAIKQVWVANNPAFNARFEAISRRYRYKVYTKKNPFLSNRALFYPFVVDKQLLSETAEIIKQYSNFEAFSKRNTQSKTFNCTIFQSYWEYLENGEYHYIVEGNRFLRGMVRGLVATQLKVARKKITIEGFKSIIEGKDCTKAFFDVDGHGLYLEAITYPEGTMQRFGL